MASFTGSAFANFYKRILEFNRATNVGVGTSLNAITDGDGGKTSIELSDDERDWFHQRAGELTLKNLTKLN